jgi:hypothetical protein
MFIFLRFEKFERLLDTFLPFETRLSLQGNKNCILPVANQIARFIKINACHIINVVYCPVNFNGRDKFITITIRRECDFPCSGQLSKIVFSVYSLCFGCLLSISSNSDLHMLYFLCKTHVPEHVNNRSDYAK